MVGEDQGEDWEGGDYWGKRRFKIGGRKTIGHMMKRMWEMIGWGRGGLLVGFGFNGPLRQYFSLYRAVSQKEGERGERIDESKNVQTTPTRTYCKRNRPLPYCNPNCRTPRHWKFTQHHRTTRPPQGGGGG